MQAIEFRRQIDSVCYRFAPTGNVNGRPAWKREDLDLWLIHRDEDGWVVVDADATILSRPSAVSPSPRTELPPEGAWLSQKSGRSYRYDLVFVAATTRSQDPRINLSPARVQDLEDLVAIRVEAMRESLERLGRFDPRRARARLVEGFAPECTRHILRDGERVGFVAVKRRPDELDLEHLYLRPRYQGLGIGSAVLTVIFAEADQLGLPLCVGALRESSSNRFYQRHGFSFVGESEWDIRYVRVPSPEGLAGP